MMEQVRVVTPVNPAPAAAKASGIGRGCAGLPRAAETCEVIHPPPVPTTPVHILANPDGEARRLCATLQLLEHLPLSHLCEVHEKCCVQWVACKHSSCADCPIRLQRDGASSRRRLLLADELAKGTIAPANTPADPEYAAPAALLTTYQLMLAHIVGGAYVSPAVGRSDSPGPPCLGSPASPHGQRDRSYTPCLLATPAGAPFHLIMPLAPTPQGRSRHGRRQAVLIALVRLCQRGRKRA